jgi:hypothetical protein
MAPSKLILHPPPILKGLLLIVLVYESNALRALENASWPLDGTFMSIMVEANFMFVCVDTMWFECTQL